MRNLQLTRCAVPCARYKWARGTAIQRGTSCNACDLAVVLFFITASSRRIPRLDRERSRSAVPTVIASIHMVSLGRLLGGRSSVPDVISFTILGYWARDRRLWCGSFASTVWRRLCGGHMLGCRWSPKVRSDMTTEQKEHLAAKYNSITDHAALFGDYAARVVLTTMRARWIT